MEKDTTSAGIFKSVYGRLPDGREVHSYILRNEAGMEVEAITLGGIITRCMAADREGHFQDVVLGFDRLEEYLGPHPFFGALVGRYANRIAGGHFQLDGQTFQLATNNGKNHLHGGDKGFDKALWKAEQQLDNKTPSLILTHRSPDGDEGYPGTLDVKVTYTLTPENALDIRYEATTDQPTIVNLTQHSYFNLSGTLSKSILDHELVLEADAFLPVDEGLIPTGEIRPVSGTPFDFRQPKAMGRDIDAANPQLERGGGYDHCWVLNKPDAGFRKIAEAYHPGSGRVLQVYSSAPGVQLYTGNFLEAEIPGKGGVKYQRRSGFCLETQHYPDSPNKPEFPSVRLDPGETYESRTRFTFKTR